MSAFRLDRGSLIQICVQAMQRAVADGADVAAVGAVATLDGLRSQIRAAAEAAGIDTRAAEDLDAPLALLIERAARGDIAERLLLGGAGRP